MATKPHSKNVATTRVAMIAIKVLLLPFLVHAIGRHLRAHLGIQLEDEAGATMGGANATQVTSSSQNTFAAESLAGKALELAARSLAPPSQSTLALLREESDWKNNLILGLCLPPSVDFESWPRFMKSWARNFVAGLSLYLIVGGLWAAVCYGPLKKAFYGNTPTPSGVDMAKQIWVSLQAMPLYTALVAVCEAIVERGYTLVYPRVDDFGVGAFVLFFVVYLTSVEFGVYWMHRSLHDVKSAYGLLHKTHHIYNKEHTLSPFAGLAFNPLDGILQAVPYVWSLFFIPTHYLTHELLLFGTAIWTTNIHDCIDGACEPIMGAGYHLLHHTNYRTNYGHYLTYCDRIFGSLEVPKREIPAKKTM